VAANGGSRAEPIGKVTVSVRIDPLLWRAFKKKCFECEVNYSEKIEELVRPYALSLYDKS
jgi:hypothetical protein